jgi:ADP-heptose:LPS heptosyltransferase
LNTKDLFRRLPSNARLLFIRLRSLGDCILLTSPLRALKTEFPSFRVSVAVDSRFAPCFDGNPDIDEIIPIARKTAALRLLVRRFRAIVNLHGGPTSLIYSCLAWGKRIGSEQYRSRWIYHGWVPAPAPSMHSVEATMSMFRWLGLEGADPPPLRYEGHRREAERMRAAVGDEPYVVIHPGSPMSTKRWEPDRFAHTARILRATGLRIVLTCGPGEEYIVGQVARGVPNAVILFGLTIPELAELIRGARLFMGHDSGPMHLAAAVGAPTVAIWGSSDARRWHPWSVAHRVVQNPFECNPCPGYRCLVAETPLCIESVTVEQVAAAAEELLQV